MAWKGAKDKPVSFSGMLSSLNNARIQQENNALYQVIFQIITKLQEQRDQIVQQFTDITKITSQFTQDIINNAVKLPDVINSTVLTAQDETLTFPNSRELLAGTGISFDDSVDNQRTINATGSITVSTVTLTDADIKALPTTDFTLVSAPGVGLRLFYMMADLALDSQAGAYTNIDPLAWAAIRMPSGGDQSIWLTDSTGPTGTQLSEFLGLAQLANVVLPHEMTVDIPSYWSLGGIIWGNTALRENKALTLYIDNNGAGNLTGGNAANTLKVNTLSITI